MAGGIDWFRWHHGTVTDQKFPLVARRAAASVAEVIAVWACLLERASMNEDERGWLGGEPDFEAMDCALGMADGKAEAIFQALLQRNLIDQERHITAWPARQPKRERDPAPPAPDAPVPMTSTERSRRHRAKQSQATPAEAMQRPATPCNASDDQATPRGEERREEPPPTEPDGSSGGGCPPAQEPDPVDAGTAYGLIAGRIRRAGVADAAPHQLRFRALVDAGATAEEFCGYADRAVAEASGSPFAYLLGIVEGERKRVARTAGQLHRGAMPVSKQSALETRNAAVAAKLAGELHEAQ